MNGFNVIGISDSWSHKNTSSSVPQFNGYELFSQDRCEKLYVIDGCQIVKKRGTSHICEGHFISIYNSFSAAV